MEGNFKFIFIVLLIISTIFLSTSIALFFLRQAEIEKRLSLEKQLEELNKEKARLTRDLDEAVTIKNDLEIQLGSLQEKAKSLEGQLDIEKKSKEALFTQLENERKEFKKVVDDLMKVRSEKEEIALNFAKVKGECETLRAQLYGIQQAKEVLENKLRELLTKSSEVELEKIVVKPEAETQQLAQEPPALPAPIASGYSSPTNEVKGEILVVNKKFDFVIVSLGEDNDIRPGMNLRVLRGEQFLATLQVEKVHANMSAAKIPPKARNADIREGDTVVVVQ